MSAYSASLIYKKLVTLIWSWLCLTVPYRWGANTVVMRLCAPCWIRWTVSSYQESMCGEKEGGQRMSFNLVIITYWLRKLEYSFVWVVGVIFHLSFSFSTHGHNKRLLHRHLKHNHKCSRVYTVTAKSQWQKTIIKTTTAFCGLKEKFKSTEFKVVSWGFTCQDRKWNEQLKMEKMENRNGEVKNEKVEVRSEKWRCLVDEVFQQVPFFQKIHQFMNLWLSYLCFVTCLHGGCVLTWKEGSSVDRLKNIWQY